MSREENVAKKAYIVWPNLTFGNLFPNLNSLVEAKFGANKSYDTLLVKQNEPSFPVKLCFFEETAKTLNGFLVQLQTVFYGTSLMDCLENIV